MAANFGNPSVTSDFIDALGDLLTDYVGIVIDIESNATQGQKGIASVKELRVMHMVFRSWRRDASCTVTEIAKETGISKTTVSRAVTTLMTNGLLREEQDPEDGRKRMLRPTAHGKKTLADVNAWLGVWAERLRQLALSDEPTVILPEPAAAGAQQSRDASR